MLHNSHNMFVTYTFTPEWQKKDTTHLFGLIGAQIKSGKVPVNYETA